MSKEYRMYQGSIPLQRQKPDGVSRRPSFAKWVFLACIVYAAFMALLAQFAGRE